jgi:hypothetical protein
LTWSQRTGKLKYFEKPHKLIIVDTFSKAITLEH